MPNPFFTRPNWEDRQVVQYTGTSITLSGDTNINYTGNFRIYKDAFPGLVATSLDSNGTVGWGPISGISWSVSACTSPLYVNNLVSCPSSGGTIQVDAGNLALNSELNFLISLSAGTNTDQVLVVDSGGYVKTVPQLGGVGNMWHIPYGYTLMIPDNYQSFVYGDVVIEGTVDLQTNAQLVILNGNIILSGGSIIGSGTTYLVTVPIGSGSGCCFTGGTGSCITDLYVSNIHSCSPLNINPLDEGNVYFGSTSGLTYDVTNKRLGLNQPNPDYTFDFNSGDGNTRFYYIDSSPLTQSIYFSGNSTVMPQLGVTSKLSSLPLTIGITMGVVGENSTSYPGYGNPLDCFLYAAANTNRLNIVSAPTLSVGTNTDDIRFYAGQFVNSGYGSDIHIQGKGVTRGFVGIGTEAPTVRLHVNGDTIVNSNVGIGGVTPLSRLHIKASGDSNTTLSLKIDDYNDNPLLHVTDAGNIYSVGKLHTFSSKIFSATTINQLETKVRGIRVIYDFTGDTATQMINLNPSGRTTLEVGSSSNGINGTGRAFAMFNHGSNFIRTAISPVNGFDFYQNKGVLWVGNNLDGMVINLDPDNNNGRLWFEQNANSPMVIAGGGTPSDLRLGIALNPNGTEMPTSNLQIGGTGTTGTFKYRDGNQSNGYVLLSDSVGNATWQDLQAHVQNGNSFGTTSTIGTIDNEEVNIITHNKLALRVVEMPITVPDSGDTRVSVSGAVTRASLHVNGSIAVPTYSIPQNIAVNTTLNLLTREHTTYLAYNVDAGVTLTITPLTPNNNTTTGNVGRIFWILNTGLGKIDFGGSALVKDKTGTTFPTGVSSPLTQNGAMFIMMQSYMQQVM